MRFGIRMAVLMREKSYRSRPTPFPEFGSADISLLGLAGRNEPAAGRTNSSYSSRCVSTQNGVVHARKSLKTGTFVTCCKLETVRKHKGEARPETPSPTAIFACF